MMNWIIFVTLVPAIIYGADIDYLRDTITNHFSQNRNHEVNNQYKGQARQFIFDEFKKYGFEVEYHNFTWDSAPTVDFANVVGVMKGANFGTADDRIVGLVAHYDTVTNTSGVDDNGAGVAAMLEVARQLGNSRRRNTIILMSPDLEEYGLVGSYKFIKDWVNPWLVRNYGQNAKKLQPHGVIVLDTMMEYNTSSYSQTIPPALSQALQQLFPQTYKSLSSDMFRGDFLAMIYRSYPDSGLAQAFSTSWEAEGRKQFEFESFPLPFNSTNNLNDSVLYIFSNFFRSDHRNFWDDNIPAIFLTDSADFRGDMIQCYHHPCDNLAVMLTDLNLQFLGKTADSIAKTVNVLSVPLKDSNSSGGTTSSFVLWSVTLLLSAILY